MANHKSAAKRARQSIRKTAVNNARKSTVKTAEKKLVKAIEAKDLKALPELLKNFSSQVMKAAKTGVIKKETASRKISRLSTRASATK
ncbi:30S ribosomal protein S20 [Bdellovibrio bacteriovorus]|uniref:Small ribosomal subunit protein bS20 n=3 Tax=Bdellovibrio bacteriovorus TaxID=959 RepID=RS20_BDEBA|nr:30S ribosomal protein S20 [Bdellovibrio bacteriovorus]Q6MMZ9.1 RecName: Full=Small ribosomal subunit protein bS20; AltName: Full=30S ribosomal protein S20 [Bdellovibrio bacteriovorus HD100]BFD59181.1 30S ribosomal protein S20 [Bdellovibrio sp. CKG001]BFD62558.1 30S ribosomal protein S20 [Bdellovibrio sp. HM001]BFD67451.1 30S ribosomal protein S20 [Bdellovibrio sp. HAGR004]AFY01157.1 30S ribosomal protein S20 [Bdellovibrio bacteriovorus str. Tiberius]AHZ84025.1 30S ribosomal protein S20 [Bd